jgi:nicotinate-nucleotide adenylyltransferase
MNIALFGTSADPPSVGHRAVIRWLADRFDLVAIWASDNPFKPDRTPLEQRTEMLTLMVETLRSGSSESDATPGRPRAAESPCHNVECRPELSHMRSIISVQRAKALWPKAHFTFAIGSDLIAQLPHWYRAANLLQECDVIAIPRPGYPIDTDALATLRDWGTVTIADVEGPAISSSAYRQTLDAAVIPAPVAAYIERRKLYDIPTSQTSQSVELGANG